jgi:zinc transport system substrate-binding protein
VPYTIAKSVLKDTADITMLIPPGAEAHSFEPRPSNAVEIKEADFFFFTSGRMEPWAMELSDGKGIALAINLPNQTRDPHVWMDFNNILVMANNLAMYVARKHPGLEESMLKNISAFNREIQMLDRLYKKMLSACKNRDIYHVGHMAFGYIAANYNLNFKPLVGAASFHHEPTAKDMALMIKEIKDKKINYIFTEEALNSKLAKTISDETKAGVLNLYTIEHISKEQFEKGADYRQFMMMNLQNISKGLGCQQD